MKDWLVMVKVLILERLEGWNVRGLGYVWKLLDGLRVIKLGLSLRRYICVWIQIVVVVRVVHGIFAWLVKRKRFLSKNILLSVTLLMFFIFSLNVLTHDSLKLFLVI